MQMAMKIVEIRIMLRATPSSPLVPWLQRNAKSRSHKSVALPKRRKLSIIVDSKS
jgi:hypothetical protein